MVVIKFDGVTKTYRLGSRAGLRETLSNAWSDLVRGNGRDDRLLNALEDVSFEVRQGEVLGFIGSNGAGKTTILKLLSRVTYPTHGSISVKGRVSALIELGAGFHPDLSGAENIYLNASILGLRRHEIDAKYDDIVAFSGLEGFLDTPVKRYSSGMYARLAFSVAAHVDPDVLLVDEVLSVGDTLFQQKCLNRMHQLRDRGKTMVFVSHNLFAVQNICSRVIWLDHGRIRAQGEPQDVINQYLHNQYTGPQDILEMEPGEELLHYSKDIIAVEDIRILGPTGDPFETLTGGKSVRLDIRYSARQPLSSPDVQIHLIDYHSQRMTGADWAGSSDKDQRFIPAGEGVITCTFESTPVRPSVYFFNVDILEEGELVYRKKMIGPMIIWTERTDLEKYRDSNIFDVGCRWALESCANRGSFCG